jgi:hypothetical protein
MAKSFGDRRQNTLGLRNYLRPDSVTGQQHDICLHVLSFDSTLPFRHANFIHPAMKQAAMKTSFD